MEYLKNIGSFLKNRFLGEDLTESEQKEVKDIVEGRKNYDDMSNNLFKKVYKENKIFLPSSNISDLITGKIKTKPIELIDDLLKGRFKYYGKWGGPNYSSGRFYDKDEIITRDDILNNQPDDDLDMLFRAHDLRYQRSATRKNAQERKEGLRYADEVFIKEATDLLNSKNLDLQQRVAAKSAILGFKAKLASDIGYNIDHLDNEEARNIVNEFFNEVDPVDNYEYVDNRQVILDNIENEYNIGSYDNSDFVNSKLFDNENSGYELEKDIETVNNVLEILEILD